MRVSKKSARSRLLIGNLGITNITFYVCNAFLVAITLPSLSMNLEMKDDDLLLAVVVSRSTRLIQIVTRVIFISAKSKNIKLEEEGVIQKNLI